MAKGVYLSDVAELNYRPKDEKLIVRNNGSRGATILVAIKWRRPVESI